MVTAMCVPLRDTCKVSLAGCLNITKVGSVFGECTIEFCFFQYLKTTYIG